MNSLNDLRQVLAEEVGRLQPPAGLEARILQQALASSEAGDLSRRRAHLVVSRPGSLPVSPPRLAALVAAALALAIVSSFVYIAFANRPKATPAGQTYQSEVAQLEAVPLHPPAFTAPADCKSGPFNSARDYGSGPVYGNGGPLTTNAWGAYYRITVYANSNIAGPILIRGEDLFTHVPLIFIGQNARGPVVRTDTVNGRIVTQHPEALLDEKNANHNVANYQYEWTLTAGLPNGSSLSVGWQIDGLDFHEAFVVC